MKIILICIGIYIILWLIFGKGDHIETATNEWIMTCPQCGKLIKAKTHWREPVFAKDVLCKCGEAKMIVHAERKTKGRAVLHEWSVVSTKEK
jgi:uncharacterized C2H2 Zn-finger protein